MLPIGGASVSNIDLKKVCRLAIEHAEPGADQVRADIVKIACSADQFPKAMRSETLPLSPDETNCVKLRGADDLVRVATWIDESKTPYVKGGALVRAAADNLRKATSENSSLELAMVIATARVIRGTSCRLVAVEHGIPETPVASDSPYSPCSPRELLEFAVAAGPTPSIARDRVRNGESCDVIATELGLQSEKARTALERYAISNRGPALAQSGKSRDEVIESLGVRTAEGKRMIEEMIGSHLRTTKLTQVELVAVHRPR